MTPEQSVQANLDVKGKVMVPVHNGTFDLAFHSWYEPLQRVSAAAQKAEVTLLTPIFGQKISLNSLDQQVATNTRWWYKFLPEQSDSTYKEAMSTK